MSVVVSDTSPLHYLILCGAPDVLPRLFTQVYIPPTVFQELQHPNTPAAVRDWARTLPVWVKVQAPTTLDPTLDVDRGELEAICLAKEIQAAAILMDDRAGRAAAAGYGLLVTGTVGVLEAAAARGLIQLPEAIERLQQTNARLDREIVQAALERDQARRERTRVQLRNRGVEPER